METNNSDLQAHTHYSPTPTARKKQTPPSLIHFDGDFSSQQLQKCFNSSTQNTIKPPNLAFALRISV